MNQIDKQPNDQFQSEDSATPPSVSADHNKLDQVPDTRAASEVTKQKPTDNKATATKKAPLFREEAVQAQEKRLEGNILLSHTLTLRNFAIFYVVLFAAIVSFLCLGSYTRKVPVVGYLEPEMGLTKVFPTSSGKAGALYVEEGDVVKKGDPLVKILIDHVSGGDYGFKRIGEEIEKSIETLISEREQAERNYQLEKNIITLDLEHNQQLIQSLARQKGQIEHKQRLLISKVDSLETLKKQNLVSTTDLNNEKMNAYDVSLSLSNIEVSIDDAKHNVQSAKLRLKKLPISHEVHLGEIDQKISDLRRQLTDTNMRHAYTILAPTDGQVAALTIKNGDNISPNFPILNIVPEWSRMQAKIYLPASAVSFVQEGQDIQVQYQALPVQRFGSYPGKVSHISNTPVNPDDFKDSPLTFNQPMYLVTAEVYDQNIDIDGQTFPIVPGMAINVSLLAEEQTILQWLLEPVWDVKDRF